MVIDAYNHSGNLAAEAAAYWVFEGLVGDGKRWDLKDRDWDSFGYGYRMDAHTRKDGMRIDRVLLTRQVEYNPTSNIRCAGY